MSLPMLPILVVLSTVNPSTPKLMLAKVPLLVPMPPSFVDTILVNTHLSVLVR